MLPSDLTETAFLVVWIAFVTIVVQSVLGWRHVRRIANLNARVRREARDIASTTQNLFAQAERMHEEQLKTCRRGLDLLKSWLSPEQLKMFEDYQHFEVRGSSTGWRYRIEWGASSHNVILFDHNGQLYARLCFVPDGPMLVPGDIMLHQKLVLEHDEMSALAVAARIIAAGPQIHLQPVTPTEVGLVDRRELTINRRATYRWDVGPLVDNAGGAGGAGGIGLNVSDPVAPTMHANFPVSLTRWTD